VWWGGVGLGGGKVGWKKKQGETFVGGAGGFGPWGGDRGGLRQEGPVTTENHLKNHPGVKERKVPCENKAKKGERY